MSEFRFDRGDIVVTPDASRGTVVECGWLVEDIGGTPVYGVVQGTDVVLLDNEDDREGVVLYGEDELVPPMRSRRDVAEGRSGARADRARGRGWRARPASCSSCSWWSVALPFVR
jgi:hypothetical protein